MAISQDTDNQQRSILKDQMFSKEFEELNIASIIVTQGKQIKGMLKEQT